MLPDLDANADAVTIQRLKLENEGWDRDPAVVEPTEPSLTVDGLLQRHLGTAGLSREHRDLSMSYMRAYIQSVGSRGQAGRTRLDPVPT